MPIDFRPLRSRAAALALLAALFLAACSTTTGGTKGPSTAPPAPWPDDFAQDALLLADEIRIEGPEGIRQHVAVRQDPQLADYTLRTVPAGLLQEIRLREGATHGEIHAQLDQWKVVALRRLVILERPGNAPVQVRAVGSAVWQDVASGQERRGNVLEF